MVTYNSPIIYCPHVPVFKKDRMDKALKLERIEMKSNMDREEKRKFLISCASTFSSKRNK